MRIFDATVIGRRRLSAHLVTVTLGDVRGCPTTGIPDEYIRLLIPVPGAEPEPRVYTVSDHRLVNGDVQIDLDIALHAEGIGSNWARTCVPGDRIGVIEPHGLYAAASGVGWQLLVADVTGLPAVARILRGLSPDQTAIVHVVLTDPDDAVVLPSAGNVELTWQIVDNETDISAALIDAVTSHELPLSDRYVWLAGEARASRAVRRYLRRELGWPQSDFYTCGYWQLAAEKWNARYEQVKADIIAKAEAVQERVGDDEGAYLDALDDIYESAGL